MWAVTILKTDFLGVFFHIFFCTIVHYFENGSYAS